MILLDGLDELLQATGVNRADYLEQVVEFQQREESAGNPVVVIVTTRTAVADRSRVPPGSVALRLEPFSDEQVAAWVTTWNRSTGAGLSLENVLRYPDLARQPLLMLMLALYDADGASLSGRLLASELYERLLCRFALREIRKHEAGLTDAALDEAVEFELLRLSVAAFAMFNRGQQWVTHDELNRDLTALMPATTVASRGFQRPLTAAQTLFGRFFFIHKAEARQDSEEISTYEFLHATFGEYLVARLIRDLLREEADHQTRRRPFQPKSTTNLAELLSFAVLAIRAPILRFLVEMKDDDPHTRPALVRLFQAAYFGATAGEGTYRPAPVSAMQSVASRTANLVLLVVTLTGRTSARELFGGAESPVRLWQTLVDLWRAGTTGEEWPAINEYLSIARTWEGETREVFVMRQNSEHASASEGSGDLLGWEHGVLPDVEIAKWWAAPPQTSLDVGFSRAMASAVTDPVFRHRFHLASEFTRGPGERARSELDDLLSSWLSDRIDPERLARAAATIDAWHERRLTELLHGHRNELPLHLLAEICRLLAVRSRRPRELLRSVFYVVARDRNYLGLVDDVLRGVEDRGNGVFLMAAITLMELEIDPSEIPATAFDVVRRMTPEDFEDIARSDPHLFYRARRIIRAEGGRYRLIWPGSAPSPSG